MLSKKHRYLQINLVPKYLSLVCSKVRSSWFRLKQNLSGHPEMYMHIYFFHMQLLHAAGRKVMMYCFEIGTMFSQQRSYINYQEPANHNVSLQLIGVTVISLY